MTDTTNGRQSPSPTDTNGHHAEPGAPSARLCHIIKWEHFDGYGFNLHAEKGKPGQMVGKVDEGSPAEAAGLREGDRIVEVNGVNIANENHKQVVQRIKAVDDETKLLVVDAEADKYFKAHDVVIKSTLANVLHLKTPPSPSAIRNGQADTPSSGRKDSLRSAGSSPEPDRQESQGDSGPSSENGTLERKDNTLNLNMTAAQFREQLASRKSTKYEAKKGSIDFKQKSDIIQKL